MSVDEMTVEKMKCCHNNEIIIEMVSVDEMTVDEMTVVEMTVVEITVDEMTSCHNDLLL
jgi:hypothetical protein